MKNNLNMQINSLTKECYTNFDLAISQEKLNFIIKKLIKLKIEKTKKVYFTELYATY